VPLWNGTQQPQKHWNKSTEGGTKVLKKNCCWWVSWPGLVQMGPGWFGLTEVGQSWLKLAKIGQGSHQSSAWACLGQAWAGQMHKRKGGLGAENVHCHQPTCCQVNCCFIHVIAASVLKLPKPPQKKFGSAWSIWHAKLAQPGTTWHNLAQPGLLG